LKEANSWEVDNKSITYRILKDCNNPETLTQGGVHGYFDAINSILASPMDSFYYEFESKYQEPRYDIRRMLLDIETSLPDQMLTKVDRASMRYALEARCPFMDKDVVEFSFRCHPDFKVYQGISKRIIKDVNHEYLPTGLMDRPKMGFGIPHDKWLRGCLKDRVMDLSHEKFLARQGIFEPKKMVKFIESYMKEGDRGKWSGHNYSRIVWSYFMFQMWYERYRCFK
jgi:asparagine synthase (glutamine-hydrolysing)